MFRKRITGGRSSIISSALNIIGMAMAFAAMYIIMVQVNYDLGYNKAIKDSDRIFALSRPNWYAPGEWSSYMSRHIGETLTSGIASVECGGTARLAIDADWTELYREPDGSGRLVLRRSFFSSGALETFSIKAVEGSLDALTTGSEIAVSESKAREFGLKVSDVLYTQSGSAKNIAAIFADVPGKNSDLRGIHIICNIGDEGIDNDTNWSYSYFVKLHSAADKELFERQAFEKLLALEGEGISKDDDIEEFRKRYTIKLFPIRDMYFEKSFSGAGASGSRTTTYTLLAIAVLTILIAFINFINFFFALVPVRMRSVNTKKILGASRATLVSGMIAESLVMIAVALLFAAGLVRLFSGSSLASLLSTGADIPDNGLIAGATAAGALIIAALASLYPALYITSFSPAFALKGSFGSAAVGKVFRYLLIGFQFTVSIALIICAAFVSMQRNYMLGHDMGFDRSHLLEVHTTETVAKKYTTVISRLKDDPRIVDATCATGPFVAPERMGWGRDFKGEHINFQCYPVSWNFLQIMGIDLVEGRDFRESDEQAERGVFIFNEAARDKFGLTLEDKLYGHNGPAEIVGFCRNFNFRSLSQSIDPFTLYVFGRDRYSWSYYDTFYIRTAAGADMKSVMAGIRKIFAEHDPSVPEDEIEVELFDKRLDTIYRSEKQLSQIVSLLTALSIIISLIGVFGLVLFEAEYRRKEIGIRRVNGARVRDILRMFNAKFIRIVLVSFAVAAPISWLVADAYLKNFSYRMDMQLWVFAAALLAVLAVTVCVVTLRSLSATLSDPVNSIRTE